MGAADAAAKEFMSIKQNFADAFNIGLFGKNLVDPERLEERNTDLYAGVFRDGEVRVRKGVERRPDDAREAAVRMDDQRVTYLILGAQHQTDVHYAMPVRDLTDSALFYSAQVREHAAQNREQALRARKRQDLREGAPESPAQDRNDSSVFLSGMRKEDKLKPVIILVLYLGEKPWDGPRSLGEMFSEEDRAFLPYTGDWKINLITPEDLPDRPEYHTSELWKLMNALKVGHRGKEELMKLEEDKAYEAVSPSMVRLVNTLLNTKFKSTPGKGGTVNMCKAMREITDEINGYKSEISGYKAALRERDDVIAQLKQEKAMLQAKLIAKELP